MDSSQHINFYLNIQRAFLEDDDNSALLDHRLPSVLSELRKGGFDYDSIIVFLFDANMHVSRSLFTYETANVISPVYENAVTSPLLFTPGNIYSEFGNKLLHGQSVLLSDTRICSFPAMYNAASIKGLIALPLIVSQKVVGATFFGIPRDVKSVTKEEMERVALVANLLAIAFRMQDTQVSLTRITQEVYKMNAQLHQLDKLKDDFVSIASHELRTPMTAIRSYVWMAINRSDMQLSERMKRYLERTLISTERLINLVNDMLNISRIESGRVDIRPQPFALGTLLTDVIFEVDAKAKERGVNVVCPQVQLPNIFADADKVHQILLNLIGNALKFTPRGGRIDVLTFSDGNFVDVSIKDNGVGISTEDLYKLFTKFGRLDNSYVAAATSGGTGLGLYICKSLVELMGGKIKASSEGIGKGTTFTFSLPVATPALIKQAEDMRSIPRGEAKGLEPVAI